MPDPLDPRQLEHNADDSMAAIMRGAIGVIPFAGPMLSEFLDRLLPQRMDRLVAFALALSEKLDTERVSRIQQHEATAEVLDLLEESVRQATRAVSDERIAYLASLLANALDNESIMHEVNKLLLRLLAEVSDAEILVLLGHTHEHTVQRDTVFHELHSELFDGRNFIHTRTVDAQNALAMNGERIAHLKDLRLFEGGSQVTRLGRMLLHSIGLLDEV